VPTPPKSRTPLGGPRCRFCGKPAPRGRACPSAKCKEKERAYWRSADLKRRSKRAKRCLYCVEAALPELKVCEQHQWERNPCANPKCGGKVPKSMGHGPPRLYCSHACWLAMPWSVRRNVERRERTWRSWPSRLARRRKTPQAER
jgi:hypothetical protein